MQEKTVTYQELAGQAQKTEKHQIVLAIADGKIRELFQTAKEGEEISFLTTADRIGHDTWVRSAVMLLMKAASDVAGSLQKGKLKVEFSIGRGLYCSPRCRLEYPVPKSSRTTTTPLSLSFDHNSLKCGLESK